MNKAIAMVEFQWLYTKAYEYDPISKQFNKWIKEAHLDTDANFKVVSSNVITNRNDDGVIVETLFVIYEYSII